MSMRWGSVGLLAYDCSKYWGQYALWAEYGVERWQPKVVDVCSNPGLRIQPWDFGSNPGSSDPGSLDP
eukprot:540693-Ditylum_brightwellii.AAC.1